MGWRLEFSKEAAQNLERLDKPVYARIIAFAEELLTLPNPRLRGKPLTGPLGVFWSYRIGDYRMLCSIKDDLLVIEVVKIGHRSKVYRR